MKKDESIKDIKRKKDQGLRPMALFIILLVAALLNSKLIAKENNMNKARDSQKNMKKMNQTDTDDNPESDEEEEENLEEVAEDDNAEDSSEEENEEEVASGDREKLNEVVTDSQEEKAQAEGLVTNQSEDNKKTEEPALSSQAEMKEQNSDTNTVEVIPYHGSVEVLELKKYESYSERRTTNGFMLNLGVENIYMADYQSQHDQQLYEELWGQEDISLPGLSLNYKFNFKLGSFTLGLGYGHGSLLDDRIGEDRTIAIDKSTVSVQFLADNLMSEPYFVPYVGASVFQFKVTEQVKSVEESFESTSEMGNSFTVGFLIQLNWAEKEVAKEAYLSQGLENTYLDVFWTQYENPNEDPKPSIQSDMNWGAGLRVEF